MQQAQQVRVCLLLSPLLTPPSTLAAGRGTCSPCHGPAQLPWCFPAHLCRVCVRATYLHSEHMLRVAANSPNKHQSQACLNIAPHGTPFIPTHSLGVKITSPLEMGPRRWCCPPGCVRVRDHRGCVSILGKSVCPRHRAPGWLRTRGLF